MRFCILVSVLFLLTSVAFALREPGFDPKDVVRQVRSTRSGPSAVGREPSALTGEFLIDTSITLVPAPYQQGGPAVAFDGVNFLVVWGDGRSGGSSDIYGARVTPAGLVLDPAGIAISTAAGVQWYPAVAFDGTNFLVVWNDCRNNPDAPDIYGARVTRAGVVLDPPGIAISTAAGVQWYPAVAFDSTNFLVVWEDYRNDPEYSDIYGARVTPGAVVLDTAGIVISQAENVQLLPAVAFDGTNFLVVWQDGRSGSYDIYGARMTPGGMVLDPQGFVISRAADNQYVPALAFDGASFLVVWTDGLGGSNIYGARVTQAGVVLDSSGIAISQAANWQGSPAVAFDGTNSLVVWGDERSGSEDIYGARVTPGGVVFDSGPVVRQEGGQGYPKLARGSGSQMFLVYQGWAGAVGGKTYNTQRIWGKMDPNPAIAEMTKPEVRMTNSGATIIRGVLFLPEASSLKPQATSCLLDVSGRKVMTLRPGANDVRTLAPGVYFVREVQAQAQAQAIRKVVVTR